MSLGHYSLVVLEHARAMARGALDTSDRGLDPTAQRDEERAHRQTRTFEVILERFVDLHVKQNTRDGRFAKERAATLDAAKVGEVVAKGPNKKLGRPAAQRLIEDHALPQWRGRLLETITRAEAHDPLADIVTTQIGRATGCT